MYRWKNDANLQTKNCQHLKSECLAWHGHYQIFWIHSVCMCVWYKLLKVYIKECKVYKIEIILMGARHACQCCLVQGKEPWGQAEFRTHGEEAASLRTQGDQALSFSHVGESIFEKTSKHWFLWLHQSFFFFFQRERENNRLADMCRLV